MRVELTLERTLFCLQGRCNRPDYANPAVFSGTGVNSQDSGSESEMSARLHHPGIFGRPGRFCPSDSRFKASRVSDYTTGPLASREGFEPSHRRSRQNRRERFWTREARPAGRRPWTAGATPMPYPVWLPGQNGASDQIRTGYFRPDKPALYRLSYEGVEPLGRLRGASMHRAPTGPGYGRSGHPRRLNPFGHGQFGRFEWN